MKLLDDELGPFGFKDELARVLDQLGGRGQTSQTLNLQDIQQSVVILVEKVYFLIALETLYGNKVVR